MKASVKLYDTDGETEYGFPVKLILYHDKKRRRRVIGYSAREDWDKRDNLPTIDHDDFEDLYGRIMDIKKKAVKLRFRELEDFDQAFEYLLQLNKRKTVDFLKYGEELATDIEKKHPGNARAWRIALKELRKFEDPVHFSDLSAAFFERFKKFKKAEGLKNTSLRAYLYALKAIYSDAIRMGVVVDKKPFEGIFKNIPVRIRRAKDHYLDEKMITKLENADFSQHNYTIARDLVLLQFYFCGLDFVDLIHLKRKQINKGRIYMFRHKMGEHAYEFDFKIFDKARAIMEKYEGEDPEYYFYFPVTYNYPTWRVRMYRALQQVKKQLKLELLPTDGTFTLKVMRHSFATLGKFKRFEEDMLREMQGHERKDMDTVYKSKYLEAERDAAQLEIIGISF